MAGVDELELLFGAAEVVPGVGFGVTGDPSKGSGMVPGRDPFCPAGRSVKGDLS